MNISDILRIAIRSIASNRMRSALTMLGIIVGVASVVIMVALGSGARAMVVEQIRSLGAYVLMVLPGEASDQGVRQEAGTGQSLTQGDAEAIASALPTVAAAAPSVRGVFQIVSGNQNWRTTVNGTTGDYFFIREWALAEGRYFTDEETLAGAKVILIGKTIATQLFNKDENPVGQSVRIANAPMTVIGVLSEKGPTGTGRDQDDIVFLPISTARQRLMGGANQIDREAVDYILVKASSHEMMPIAEQQIAWLLRQRHGLRPAQSDDFRVTDPAATMAAQTASTRVLSWLLASVASVSLVVGGISIMNIMLVSVAERRREIGLRLAVGARRRHIRMQFLVEALVVCLLGGAVGLIVGIFGTALLAGLAGWPAFLSPAAMVMAILFAGITGVFFGYYPARIAARSNPIDCLRSN
ncbi:ABC transporter permease [Yoonia sediminilitoris]|uniref:Putative ABC transport system permease protein n=1 Tax=Yoonia sediminilitoris TaxID=1286148 RepID=A0A2T6K8U7_9RHOB|nr:ABC transporter permease [Yoonia sediminilitoris]PUB11099.1 putative ABC transport system permease protein [Yoonia sediminilitoris]RCW91018.1 putative ABC transport system permease protein [Yoonia sediminilitoris]